MNDSNKPKSLQDALSKLSAYTYSVETDIRMFLDTPDDFHPTEYFEDVLIAAEDVSALVQWLRDEVFGVEGATR